MSIEHHALKTFKQLSAEDQLVKTWGVSDRQGSKVQEIDRSLNEAEQTLMEFPKKDKGRIRPTPSGARSARDPFQDTGKGWGTFQIPLGAVKMVGRVAELWNVPRSAVYRYALWLLMEKYEFFEGEDAILSKKDRKATVRDSRVRRPFTKRAEAERKTGSNRDAGLRNTLSDHSKRPPRILNDLSRESGSV